MRRLIGRFDGPSERIGAALRLVQHALLVVLVAWVGVHTVVIGVTGWSAWRLGGMAMYAVPTRNYRAASVVACGSPECRFARERMMRAAEEAADPYVTPLLQTTRTGDFEVVASGRVSPRKVVRDFLTFPTAEAARTLVGSVVARPRGDYLVTHHRQRVSMPGRVASVDEMVFVVGFDDGES